MATPALIWNINPDRGTISFGRLVPFAGNTYPLTLNGGAEDQTYTAFVMTDDGLNCLAKSEYDDDNDAYSIAFNTQALRDEFVREMHEVRCFHCIVKDGVKIVAEGDLPVLWNPLWADIETGEVYSMKGDPGDKGEQGLPGEKGNDGMSAYEVAVAAGYSGTAQEWLASLKGAPGSLVRVQKISSDYSESGKWHNIYIKEDSNGRLRIVIDKNEYEPDPDTEYYITRTGDVMVDGTKTFAKSPLVPTVSTTVGGQSVIDLSDDSTKAVNTHWLKSWWTAILGAAITFADNVTFSKFSRWYAAATGHNTMDVNAATDAVTVNGSETHNGAETHTGTETHSGAATFNGNVSAKQFESVNNSGFRVSGNGATAKTIKIGDRTADTGAGSQLDAVKVGGATVDLDTTRINANTVNFYGTNSMTKADTTNRFVLASWVQNLVKSMFRVSSLTVTSNNTYSTTEKFTGLVPGGRYKLVCEYVGSGASTVTINVDGADNTADNSISSKLVTWRKTVTASNIGEIAIKYKASIYSYCNKMTIRLYYF